MEKTKKKNRETQKSDINLIYAQITACAVVLAIALGFRFLDRGQFTAVKLKYTEIISSSLSISDIIGSDKSEDGIAAVTEPTATESESDESETSETEAAETDTEEPTENDSQELFNNDSVDALTPLGHSDTIDVLGKKDTDDAGENSANSLALPVDDFEVTDVFGERTHPITGEHDFHGGVDLATDYGSPIFSALDGTVRSTNADPVSGKYLIINHGNGIETFYCHCSELVAEKGETVKKGQVIAKVGDTGSATGPHCHFEIRINGKKIDPMWILDLNDGEDS